MVDAFAYGQRLMVEQRIEGRDVAVSVVDLEGGPVALPPVEIATDDGRYDYDARYTTDESEYFVPARFLSRGLADMQAAAVEAHTTLGSAGTCRAWISWWMRMERAGLLTPMLRPV